MSGLSEFFLRSNNPNHILVSDIDPEEAAQEILVQEGARVQVVRHSDLFPVAEVVTDYTTVSLEIPDNRKTTVRRAAVQAGSVGFDRRGDTGSLRSSNVEVFAQLVDLND